MTYPPTLPFETMAKEIKAKLTQWVRNKMAITDDKPTLVQLMAWRRTCNNTMNQWWAIFLTHICVTFYQGISKHPVDRLQSVWGRLFPGVPLRDVAVIFLRLPFSWTCLSSLWRVNRHPGKWTSCRVREVCWRWMKGGALHWWHR